MGNVDALGKLGTVRQDGSGNTSGFAAEEARLLDELLASADLSSHETPEARPVHQLGDAGTPDDQGIESLEPTSEQLQAQAETTPPAAGDEPSSSAFTLTDTTAPNEDLETIEFEALHLNEIESEEQARTSLADTAQKSLEQPATMAPAWTYDYEAPTPQDAPANGAGPSAPVEAGSIDAQNKGETGDARELAPEVPAEEAGQDDGTAASSLLDATETAETRSVFELEGIEAADSEMSTSYSPSDSEPSAATSLQYWPDSYGTVTSDPVSTNGSAPKETSYQAGETADVAAELDVQEVEQPDESHASTEFSAAVTAETAELVEKSEGGETAETAESETDKVETAETAESETAESETDKVETDIPGVTIARDVMTRRKTSIGAQSQASSFLPEMIMPATHPAARPHPSNR